MILSRRDAEGTAASGQLMSSAQTRRGGEVGMTFGQLFMIMNQNVKVKENRTCYWLYFDESNHHTFSTKWWNTEIKALPDIVRCKDCKHRPKEPDWETYESGFDIEFPEGSKCPCQCSGDQYYSWYPKDDWYCANGERKED